MSLETHHPDENPTPAGVEPRFNQLFLYTFDHSEVRLW